MPDVPHIELILAQQLASYMSLPIFIVDVHGDLIFYNERAERILGRRFAETGTIPLAELATLFATTTEGGLPLANDALPITIAAVEGRPAQRSFWMRGLDHVTHHIDVTAFPLINEGGQQLGTVALIWEG